MEGAGRSEELIVQACRLAFEDLQDLVDEGTTNPWPAERGNPPSPTAAIEPRSVVIWFGARETPVLEVEPLPLDL